MAVKSEARSTYGPDQLPLSQVLEEEVQKWRKSWRTLRKEDQKVFVESETPYQSQGVGRKTVAFETTMISMRVEREKEMEQLRKCQNIRG